jgi:hypothetical protein
MLLTCPLTVCPLITHTYYCPNDDGAQPTGWSAHANFSPTDLTSPNRNPTEGEHEEDRRKTQGIQCLKYRHHK